MELKWLFSKNNGVKGWRRIEFDIQGVALVHLELIQLNLKLISARYYKLRLSNQFDAFLFNNLFY